MGDFNNQIQNLEKEVAYHDQRLEQVEEQLAELKDQMGRLLELHPSTLEKK